MAITKLLKKAKERKKSRVASLNEYTLELTILFLFVQQN